MSIMSSAWPFKLGSYTDTRQMAQVSSSHCRRHVATRFTLSTSYFFEPASVPRGVAGAGEGRRAPCCSDTALAAPSV